MPGFVTVLMAHNGTKSAVVIIPPLFVRMLPPSCRMGLILRKDNVPQVPLNNSAALLPTLPVIVPVVLPDNVMS